MKANLLLPGLLGLAQAAAAQQPAPGLARHTVSVGVFGLASNAGLEYEQRLGRHGALALQGARYFSADYPGYQAALVGRYYFKKEGPGGLYLQLSVGAFTHKAQAQPAFYPGLPSTTETYATTVHGQGGGLGLGYRWPLGARLSLNTLVGIKAYVHDVNRLGGPGYVGDWYAAGQPGSVLDTQASLSYSF